jgi:WD40 repeat protein
MLLKSENGFSDCEETYVDLENEEVVEILDENSVLPSDTSGDGEDIANTSLNAEASDSFDYFVNSKRDDAIRTFSGHTDSVFCFAVAESVIISGGCDDLAIIWNKATGEIIHILKKHCDSIVSIAISCDEKFCATGSLDGAVYIWSIPTGFLLAHCEGCNEVEWVRFHPKGPIVLAGSTEGAVWMWNALTGTFLQVFNFHCGTVNCGNFTPNGKLIVTGGSDGTLLVWNPKTGTPKFKFCKGSPNWSSTASIISMDWSTNSQFVAIGDEVGDVKIIHINSGKVVSSLEGAHSESVECLSFSNEKFELLSSGSLDGSLKIWNVLNFTLHYSLSHPEGVVVSVWHPSLSFVFTACLDAIARCWDARGGCCLLEFHGLYIFYIYEKIS